MKEREPDDRVPVKHEARVSKLRKGGRYRWTCRGCGRRSFLYRTAGKADQGARDHEHGLLRGSWK